MNSLDRLPPSLVIALPSVTLEVQALCWWVPALLQYACLLAPPLACCRGQAWTQFILEGVIVASLLVSSGVASAPPLTMWAIIRGLVAMALFRSISPLWLPLPSAVGASTS
jgi:hypothetical protein